MKKDNKYINFIIIFLVLFLVLFWRTGKINNYLPFFLTTDGWNKIEREINTENILINITGNKDSVWNAKIKGLHINQENVSVDVVLVREKMNFVGVLSRTWQEDYRDNFQYRGDLVELLDNNSTGTKKNVILYFEKKNCIDVDGKIYTYIAELNFNGEKIYTGCARILGGIE